ncbi:TPA: hypothetical protein DIV55_04330 [Patescibacteria group bacterium]|nr:hypothetical protein [Patescibacteria group bacterium]
MTNQSVIDQTKIDLYKLYFRGREDIYARFWNNPYKKSSGFSPVYTLNKQTIPFSDNIILDHLNGKEVIGIYPLLKKNTTFFLVIDFDRQNWLREAQKVVSVAQKHKLSCYLERSRSGKGGHVWFFFEINIPAWKARQLGKLLLNEAHILSRHTFDRLFPSQDEHSGKGFGNLIVLPLSGKYLPGGNTTFVNETGLPYHDQWDFLSTCRKVSVTQVDTLIQSRLTTSFPQQTHEPKIVDQVTPAENEESDTAVKTTDSPQAQLVLKNQIFIPETQLPDKLYKFLKSKLNFSNPQFYELERRGYSTWNTPRFLKNIERTETGILVPAGFLSEIQAFAIKNDLALQIKNQQVIHKPISFKTKLQLRSEQQKISKELLTHDRVILEAKPAFGKTIVALYCMKWRRQKTLIVVHTRALLQQWKKRIEEWFELKNKDIGIIGENKWQIGNKVTIASYQTLARRGMNEVKNTFGLVIIDECHHVPASTFKKVIKQISAKYILGLTATAFRKDQLERLMTFYIGPIIKVTDEPTEQLENNKQNAVPTKLITKKTTFQINGKSTTEFTELANYLISNTARNQQIVTDVTSALNAGMKCLILTERIEHCQTFLELVRKEAKGIHAAIAEGNMTRKKRERLLKRIRQEKFQLLIATGKLIGEGFDWPELTHLFLAFPFSWKGKLIQYVGRVQRVSAGKSAAYVYDYVDFDVQMLKIMYFKRLRTYRALGLTKEKTYTTQKSKISENQLGLFT